jgi:hypothetical protein
MKKASILMRLGALLLGVMALCAAAPAQDFDSSAEAQITALVNRERAAAGLGALKPDIRLGEAARKHAVEMVKHKALSHQFEGEQGVATRIAATGIRFDASGENVAFAGSAETAHTSLMNSPPHRANILDSKFTGLGVAALWSGKDLYIVQDFVRLQPEFTIEEAEKRLAQQVSELRRGAGKSELKWVRNTDLRQEACRMAKVDLVSTKLMRRQAGVSTTLVFNTADLTVTPKALRRMMTAGGTSYAIGVCYSASASHAIPTYWIAIVTYF